MAKATVVSVTNNPKNPNGKDFVFQLDGVDKQSKIVDFAKKTQGLNAGDRIDISLEVNQKGYNQIVSVQKIHDQPNGSSVPVSAPSGGGNTWRPDDPKKQKQIQRSVAVKVATELVVGMMAYGYLKKSANMDLITGIVQELCVMYEPYLLAETDWQSVQTEEIGSDA